MDDLKKKNDTQLDTRLLSEAIIELNISRHNVSVYPEGHPIVEKSLDKAHTLFQEFLQLRNEISLAIAKDTIIVDEQKLDKKQPVFKDFALCLSKMNIAKLTISRGMTKDELYSFYRFLIEDYISTSSEHMQREFQKTKILHIRPEFIDYSVFDFVDEDAQANNELTSLWEKYALGLLEGALKTQEHSDVLHGVSPEQLAQFINRVEVVRGKEENYDNVIKSYLTESSQRTLTSANLKKLFDCIYRLRPELKRQFLKSAVNTVSQDIDSLNAALKEMPLDTIKQFIDLMNDEMVIIPDALKNILDKLGHYEQHYQEDSLFGGSLLEDDILLSSDVTSLMSETNFKAFVSDAYQSEIKQLLRCKPSDTENQWIKQFENEWNDEYIERMFHETMLELLSSDRLDVLLQDGHEFMEQIIRDHISKFVETSQYEEVVKTIQILEKNKNRPELSDLLTCIIEYLHSQEFLSLLVNSLRISGRHRRDESIRLCECFGSHIVPLLMDALIDEESQTSRRYLISLLSHLGDETLPELFERLKDDRWFVKRNMLFILLECGKIDDLKKALPYCNHENPKVSFAALKCLLQAKDARGTGYLRAYLRADSKELVQKAVGLAGAYRVIELIPELARLIRRTGRKASDFEDKVFIAKALGQIGEADALVELKKILKGRSFFFKRHLDKLKKEIQIILRKKPDNGSGLSKNVEQADVPTIELSGESTTTVRQ